MHSDSFTPGQRWVSHTEAELGLGRVVAADARRVTLFFPAAEEERTYARAGAPLSRIGYEPGDRIRTEAGDALVVASREEVAGCFRYHGHDPQGRPGTVDELQLESFVGFNRPQDRLFTGQIDANKAFVLRQDTLRLRHRHQSAAGFGLLGPRIELLPHQLYIADQVARRHAPRVLLADEVGLGKTIEAGLILHHQLLGGLARRVLVMVPDSLLHQWLVEMLRRFNLHFTLLDRERCQALVESGEANPFESAQLILCSQSLLSEQPELQAAAMACAWDLLVVDEAHHLYWSEADASPEYRSVEALARRTPGLLLLTATPEQLGQTGHFARLRLLDPDRYYDYAAFLQEQEGYGEIRELVEALEAVPTLEALYGDAPLQARLLAKLGAASLEHLLQQDQPLAALERALLDRFGTGRVLYRNTRDTVAGFAPRRLHPHPLPVPAGYRPSGVVERSLQAERLLGDDWLQRDPRVPWLMTLLRAQPAEKLLVICARAETARDLEAHLRLREGVRSAVFHEGMTLINRDRAAAYFADPDAGAQVLICSEIGSEGRNFQFSRHLVLFDLPLNPDLLEQRIGRLDRIGQRHAIAIHVPYYQGSPQEWLLQWHHRGLDAFLTACTSGTALFERFKPRLEAVLRGDDSADLAALLEETALARHQLETQLEQGRDRLLELNSCHPKQAAALTAAVAACAEEPQLNDYVERLFDHFDVRQEEEGPAEWILSHGERMQGDDYPGLPASGCRATTSRALALHREDLAFLTWEHPMVWEGMEMLLSQDLGNTALCSLHLPPLKPGTLLLEAIFVIHCAAPPGLRVQRYLPEHSIRILIDEQGNQLGSALAIEVLNQRVQTVPRDMARQIATQARERLRPMLSRAEALAEAQSRPQIEEARARVTQLQGGELERLRALAAVNPAIREDEIARQRAFAAALSDYLDSARLGLDGVRVILVN